MAEACAFLQMFSIPLTITSCSFHSGCSSLPIGSPFFPWCCCCAVLKVGATLSTTLIATQGVWITSSCPTLEQETQACTGRIPGSLCARDSCASLRRHGKTQPEDAPYGWFGPDLPCYPPLSHGPSRCEVDDRRTRRLRARHKWKCLTVSVKHCVSPYDLCVACPHGASSAHN